MPEKKADLDTIAIRLQTRHAGIERVLETALARARLPRTAIAELAGLARQAEVARMEEARKRLESRPVGAGVSWEELCRPSLEALSAVNPRSLRRA